MSVITENKFLFVILSTKANCQNQTWFIILFDFRKLKYKQLR